MPLSAEENVLLDEIAARIHREGVIEGLERALHLRQYGVIEADHIRDEIERHCRREGGLTVDEYERIQQRDGREEIIRLRAEVEKLTKVRNAAVEVAAALREHKPRCACTICSLRAALDAANGEDVEVDDGTRKKSKA